VRDLHATNELRQGFWIGQGLAIFDGLAMDHGSHRQLDDFA
jgi:hypothetical protein